MTSSAGWLSALAVACWGVGALFDKLALDRMAPKPVFFGRLYLMFIFLLTPMVLAWDETRLAVSHNARFMVLYLAGSVVFTVGGLYLYYMALSQSQASRIVPLCAAYPLVTFLLAVAFLKEPFSTAKLAGTALVVSGTYLLAGAP